MMWQSITRWFTGNPAELPPPPPTPPQTPQNQGTNPELGQDILNSIQQYFKNLHDASPGDDDMYTPYKPGAGVTEEGELYRYYILSKNRNTAKNELKQLKRHLANKYPDKRKEIYSTDEKNQWIHITRPDTTREGDPYILAVAADMIIFSPVPKPDFNYLRPSLKF